MEAGGVYTAHRNTLHATAQILPSQRFPIHQWEPRTGYNEDYIKWKLDVDQLAHALCWEAQNVILASQFHPSELLSASPPPWMAHLTLTFQK